MTRPQSNSPSSEALYHRLNAYALTAATTGVASLALAPYATASVVYTPAQINIVGPNAFYQLDLNHDGIVDFNLGNAITTNTDQFFWQLKLAVPPETPLSAPSSITDSSTSVPCPLVPRSVPGPLSTNPKP